MNDPDVSILMPVADGTYLRAAIESLLAQNFSDFELIVVNDGAGAETVAEIDNWASLDRRVTRIGGPERLGLPAALNLGLARCRGSLVARADADDVYHPERLQRQVPVFETRPNLCALSCGYRRIDVAGRVIETATAITGPALLRFRLMFLNPILHPGVVFRRDVVRKLGGYDPRYWTAQDTDLWARLVQVGEIDNVPEPLVDWRKHGNSALSTRGSAGRALSTTISMRLQSAYLRRSISFAEAADARDTWRSFEPLPVATSLSGERLLTDIYARAEVCEPPGVLADFRATTAAALARQAGWCVRRALWKAPRLAIRSARWRSGKIGSAIHRDDAPEALRDMSGEPLLDAAAPRGPSGVQDSHALPVFEGRQSQRHQHFAMHRLRASAVWDRFRRGDVRAPVFLQFVGFPRSGHSLIGALLNAQQGALIAHELDAMGLVAKGLPVSLICNLIASNARSFAWNGSWWNGFTYNVPGKDADRTGQLNVIGDKKGDWAARWCAAEPDLIDRLHAATSMRCKWVLVTRHPLDNVATMSLRQGGTYDHLRIVANSGDAFRDALAGAQRAGEITTRAKDSMIEDYRALAASVAKMKAKIDPADWLEIVYEDFAREPRTGLGSLTEFAGLETDTDRISLTASVVRQNPNRTRDLVTWTEAQRQALYASVSRHDFLRIYADDF